MRSGNPTLNNKVFQAAQVIGADRADTMTIGGTATKTLILLAVVVVLATIVWSQTGVALETTGAETIQREGQIRSLSALPGNVLAYLLVGLIGGLITALVVSFKPTTAPIGAPIYAAFEGAFLGAFSAMFEFMYPGIVLQAVLLTFGTMFSLLAIYQTGLIRATENFKLGIMAATGGIALVYLATIVLGLFGISIPLIHQTGWVGIGFSVFVVVIAALNLVLDFDFIEKGSEHGAPKYMEWYGAFGLLVTLIWLYIEIVRLLAKLQSRD